MKTNMMQQEVSVKKEKDPALNVAVNVSSKQNIAAGKGGADAGADAGAEDEEEDEATRKSRKSKKKKKKRSKREVESSTSSDDSDTDGDRAKSKKKATAGVSTRINIFTGAQGPPGVGMQSGMTGPNVLSNMTAPLPVIQQQLPMLPVVQQVSAPPKKDRSKRSTKSTKSKGSQGRQSAAGMPAVIPPAMAGLVSGPDGQDVLVIPMPPGMKIPAFDAGIDQIFGAGFPFTDAQQQQPKKKKKKSADATDGVPRKSVSSTAVDQQVRQPGATMSHPELDAVAGVGKFLDDRAVQAALQQNQQAVPPGPQANDAGHEGEWEPAPSEAMADGQERQSSTAPSQMGMEASPSKKSLSSEDDTNTMALLIFAAVIGIIVIVIIVFIVATAGTPTGTSLAATTIHDSYGSQPNTHPPGFRGRRRAIRRHPSPHKNYIAQLRRFKRPVEAYWNIK